MIEDVLNGVLSAEKKAEEIKAESDKKAASIVAEAEEQAAIFKAQAEKKAKAERAVIITRAEKKAGESYDAFIEQSKADAKELEKKCVKNVDSLSVETFGRIVNGNR